MDSCLTSTEQEACERRPVCRLTERHASCPRVFRLTGKRASCTLRRLIGKQALLTSMAARLARILSINGAQAAV